jgi:APA family basic amino acid/polyamine antiporter
MIKRGETSGGLLISAAVLGTIFAIWAFYGAGREATGWGAVLVATGIPVYFLMRWRAGSSLPAAASPAVPPGSSA